MSEFKSYREGSKKNWGTDSSAGLTMEQINCGALLRIADASELMAKNHIKLIDDLEWYKRKYKEEQAASKRLCNRVRGLKSVLTRIKNKSQR